LYRLHRWHRLELVGDFRFAAGYTRDMHFTDEQPFLDAIFARYHDDAPRLVYADYLDEAGDPARAELVRVQVALARLPDDHPRRTELVDRQDELRAANAERWNAPVADLGAQLQFRRGVPDYVIIYAGTLLSDGEELFRRARVRRLRLLEAAAVMPKLIHSPLLGQVRELDLCANELGNHGVNLLVRSPHLHELEELDLAANWLDDAGVQALARAGTMPRLAALALNDNEHITAEGVAALAGSPSFAGLTSLDLSGNDLTDAAVRAILQGEAFARIDTLRLARNPISDAGVAALARSSLLPRLLSRSPRLELRGTSIGPTGAAALAASPALRRCAALDLTDNYLGDQGLAAVITSPHLERLHTLKLGGNQITDAGVVAVRDALPGLFRRLRVFDLPNNRLTHFGIGELQRARGDSATALDVKENIQVSAGRESPVALGEVVPGVLRDVAEVAQAAALRRRVSHPATRTGDHPNPQG
jgi:uncharacterized protein (TIGR02996 family)